MWSQVSIGSLVLNPEVYPSQSGSSSKTWVPGHLSPPKTDPGGLEWACTSNSRESAPGGSNVHSRWRASLSPPLPKSGPHLCLNSLTSHIDRDHNNVVSAPTTQNQNCSGKGLLIAQSNSCFSLSFSCFCSHSPS